MKSKSKIFGVLLTTMVLAATTSRADDKSATPPTGAPATTNKTVNPADLFPDEVICTGKGFEIKRSRMDEAVSGIRASAAQRGRELSPADLPMIKKSSFDHLLQVQLLKASATDADKTKAAAKADERMAMIKKRAQSDEALERQLKSMNLTVDQLRDRLIEEATAEEVLRDKVTVTDDQIKKFYDENPSQFEEPETVKASHILILTTDKSGAQLSDDQKAAKKKIIDGLLVRARAGEDFAKLAKEYSEDPGSKENGGEYVFPRGRMVKEFEAAAFTLQTNQISDIVTTQYGYHIIKLTEKFPAKKLEFDKVKPDIRNYLETQQMEKVLPDLVAQLRKDADVKILDEELKTLDAAATEAAKSKAAAPSPAAPK